MPYNADRTVTQDGDCLSIQMTGRAAWRNELFNADLSASDLQTLSRLISSEVESAYRRGWEDALAEAWREYARSGTPDDEDPDFDIEPTVIGGRA